MRITPLAIEGALLIQRDAVPDGRGWTGIDFSREMFSQLSLNCEWDRILTVMSFPNVIRGLHYQTCPNEEIKVVSCVSGTIYDVLVDTRNDSKTYGKKVEIKLTGGLYDMLYIPQDVAHGYQALELSRVQYLIRGAYDQKSERGIIWNDPTLKINWPLLDPFVSKKDQQLPQFGK